MDSFGTFSGVGAMKPEEVRQKRAKDGQCLECGRQCFKVSRGIFKKKTPLTIEGKVLDGKCLRCAPDYRRGSSLTGQDTSKRESKNSTTEHFVDSGRSLNSAVSKLSTDNSRGSANSTANSADVQPIFARVSETEESILSSQTPQAPAVNGGAKKFVTVDLKNLPPRASSSRFTASSVGMKNYNATTTWRNSLTSSPSGNFGESVMSTVSINDQAISLVNAIEDVEDLASMMYESFADIDMQRAVVKRIQQLNSSTAVVEQIINSNISILTLDSIEEHITDQKAVKDLWKFLLEITLNCIQLQDQLLSNSVLATMGKTLDSNGENDDVMDVVLDLLLNLCDSICRSNISIQTENVRFLSNVLQSQTGAYLFQYNLLVIYSWLISVCHGNKVSLNMKHSVIVILKSLCRPGGRFFGLFAASEGVGGVIEFMFASESIVEYQIDCCNFIESFASDEKIIGTLLGEGVILQISQSMSAYPDNAKLQADACKALKAMIFMGHAEIMHLGIADLVMKILPAHPKSKHAVKEALSLLCGLIKIDHSYGAMLSSICQYDLKNYLQTICEPLQNRSEVKILGSRLLDAL